MRSKLFGLNGWVVDAVGGGSRDTGAILGPGANRGAGSNLLMGVI